jgi:hypothetical protein
LLFGDPDEPGLGADPQERVEAPQADVECFRRGALAGFRRGVELAQEAEEQVFLGRGGVGSGHGSGGRIMFVHG